MSWEEIKKDLIKRNYKFDTNNVFARIWCDTEEDAKDIQSYLTRFYFYKEVREYGWENVYDYDTDHSFTVCVNGLEM